jgi:cytochrome c
MCSTYSPVMLRGRDVLLRIALSAALAAPFHTAWAAGTPPQELLERYRCTTCHATSDAAAGPAWADIAMHYRGKQQANKVVAEKIRSGAHGSGPWHMPPHPEVSQADAATMARYILSTRSESADK